MSACVGILPDTLRSLRRSSHCGCCSDNEHTAEQITTSECEATTPTAADGKNREHTPADRRVRERQTGQGNRRVRETDVLERQRDQRNRQACQRDRCVRKTDGLKRHRGQSDRQVRERNSPVRERDKPGMLERQTDGSERKTGQRLQCSSVMTSSPDRTVHCILLDRCRTQLI